LNLSYNHIDDEGAEAIGIGLSKNNTLKLIDLTGNRIRDAGAISIA